MTINYICEGFDKDFYTFDAVVIPVMDIYNRNKSIHKLYNIAGKILNDFHNDFRNDCWEIIQGLTISAFKQDGVTVVKSEKIGIYYIFVLVHSYECPSLMEKETFEIERHKNYIYCCNKMVEYIKNIDAENILVSPQFNRYNFIKDKDSDFLAKTLKSSIDRFSKKNIYIFVEELNTRDDEFSIAFRRMERRAITPEECMRIYMKNQMEKSLSYTNSLIRIAEIETKYKPQTIAEQFREDMNNDSWFFDEYINKYSGTASELAKNSDIDNSTISTIKNHKYKEKSKTVVIALAIALDLTIDDRKRFINSAGFSYPTNEHDRFIEQQLRKKRYTSVIDFNEDIMDEYPKFIVKTRSFRKCKAQESDK